MLARDAALTRREVVALGGLVLASAALRTWASRGVPTPWITPDETLYGLLGQGLWRDGRLAVLGGPTPYYSAVVPALVGLPLSLGDLALGYSLLKALQALVMSLATVPVYLWGRTLTTPRWAFLAAALTVALPGLAYSGLVMTEAAFYPVLVVAAWAAARAIERPTLARQVLFAGVALLALATRLQAVVLLPAFATAVGVDALIARRRVRLRPFAPTLVAAAAVAAAWIVWRLARGGGLLAGYGGASGSYAVGDALRFAAYHAGDLALLTGLLPAAALVLLLARRETDPRVRAFVAVTAATAFWLVLEVGVFASRELGLLAERNLIAAAPLLFLALAVWLGRGAPGTWPARTVTAGAIAVAVLALPLGKLLVPDQLPHAFTLVPLFRLREAASLGAAQLALALGVAAAVALLLARRAAALVPVAVLAALVAGSVSASREVRDEARAQQLRLLGPDRRWIDDAADGAVAYVYDGQAWWNAVWENAFWNRDVRWIYDLPATRVPGDLPGDLPQQLVEVRPDGELRPRGARSPAGYAVVPLHMALRGTRVVEAPQFGTDRQGLGLWRLEPPLRLSTITSGLFPNGDVDREAALTVYDCRDGTFDAVLLVKEPQTVRVLLDGRRVESERFETATTWHVTVPVAAAATARVCKLRIVPGALLGSTRLAFERG
jgi:hypothetical protein